MADFKLSDGERKVMNVIWDSENITAREVVDELGRIEGWNKNTTYTVLNRLIQKSFIKREEPSFICIPIITREEATYEETRSFLKKLYNGSFKMMVSSFLSKEKLSDREIDELKNIIDSGGKNNTPP